jgi:Transport and Golgi organisation 2
MCTVVVLRRPAHRWPLILAANRDEMANRPWRPPGRYWADRPEVVAGRDELAGGTWLGLNDHGVVAGVLNRKRSLGPDPDLRSRGELPLEALDHADAVDAVAALAQLDGRSYRAFNMIVADNRDAWWIKGLGPDGPAQVAVAEVPEGVSMLTSLDLNERASERVARYLPRFEAASPPEPDTGNWAEWEALLAIREDGPENGRERAMCVVTDTGFGTLSSSLIALPAAEFRGIRPIWRFAAGRPGEARFETVEG